MDMQGATETSNGNGMSTPTHPAVHRAAKVKTKAKAKQPAAKVKAKPAKKAAPKAKAKSKSAKKSAAPKAKKSAKKAVGSVYEQTVAFLKRNPKADYGKLAAKVKGAMPVLFGRAKLALGLVKAKPRKVKIAKASVEGSLRSPKSDNMISDFGLYVTNLERRSRKLDQALAQIAAIAAE